MSLLDRVFTQNERARMSLARSYFDNFILEGVEFPAYRIRDSVYSRFGDEHGRKSFFMIMSGVDYDPRYEFFKPRDLIYMLPQDIQQYSRFVLECDRILTRKFQDFVHVNPSLRSIRFVAASAFRSLPFMRDLLDDMMHIDMIPDGYNKLEWNRWMTIHESDHSTPGMEFFETTKTSPYPIIPEITEEVADQLRLLYRVIVEQFCLAGPGSVRPFVPVASPFEFYDDLFGSMSLIGELGTERWLYGGHTIYPVEWYYERDPGLRRFPLWMLVKLQQWLCVGMIQQSIFSGTVSYTWSLLDIANMIGIFLLSHGVIDSAVRVINPDSRTSWVM